MVENCVMSVRLVLPLKSLHAGKTRLAQVLDTTQRAALIDRLLTHAFEQAAQFPGLQNTLLVSACEQARARATAHGVGVVVEPAAAGLNQALRRAQRAVSETGAQTMLVIPCDLPLLTADDLRCLVDCASTQAVALAPDRFKQGTNGICLPSSIAFEFAFGPGSYGRHRSNIERLHLRAVNVERPGLAFDVDTPDDLTQLRDADAHLSCSADGG
jgi:2-phospho-L-lactate/phosphoenolpyruvate guanylyltransferase